MMIRTLLVDDEYYIRERLKIMLDWESLGFTVVGEAENGRQALERLNETSAQLLLIDIKMPEMSGLELAKEIHETHPHVFIIILTGFNTFEYARQAIQYGVSSYLLKPIDRAELKEQLCLLKRKFEDQQRNQCHLIRAREFLFDDCLNSLVFEGTEPSGEFSEERIKLEKDFAGQQAHVALFWLQESRMKQALRSDIYKLFQDAFPNGGCYAFHVADTMAGLYFYCNSQFDSAPALSRFCGNLSAGHALSTHFGVSRAFPSLSGFRKAFQEALFALREGIFFKEAVLPYDKAVPGHCQKTLPIYSLRDQLLMELRSCRLDKAVEMVRERFRLLAKGYRSYANFTLLAYELVSVLAFYSESTLAFHTDNKLHIDKLLEGFASLPEFLDWFINALTEEYHMKNQKKVSAQYLITQHAKSIIDRDYCDPACSLDYVSSRVGCNSSYLSGVFKKITGLSVVQYITNCRMGYARELLENHCGTLAVICEKVGYNDAYYFSKRFKQYFGVSPSGFSVSGTEDARAGPGDG